VPYAAPLRTYVFASLIFFAVAALTGNTMVRIGMEGDSAAGVERANEIVNASLSYGHFFLVPIFALILMALFRRPSRYYIEHLVFALHYGAFAFLFFSLMGLVVLVIGIVQGVEEATVDSRDPRVREAMGVLLYGTIFAYLVLALKRFYGRSWTSTIVRSALVSVLYLVAFGVLVAAVFVVAFKLA
jgi:hypothetical protein